MGRKEKAPEPEPRGKPQRARTHKLRRRHDAKRYVGDWIDALKRSRMGCGEHEDSQPDFVDTRPSIGRL